MAAGTLALRGQGVGAERGASDGVPATAGRVQWLWMAARRCDWWRQDTLPSPKSRWGSRIRAREWPGVSEAEQRELESVVRAHHSFPGRAAGTCTSLVTQRVDAPLAAVPVGDSGAAADGRIEPLDPRVRVHRTSCFYGSK
jgi:hypothetical protein